MTQTITCSDYCKLLEERDKQVAVQQAICLSLHDKYKEAERIHRGNRDKLRSEEFTATFRAKNEAYKAYEAANTECSKLENSVRAENYNITYPQLTTQEIVYA